VAGSETTSGQRKQFVEINGHPVLVWSLEAIRSAGPVLTVIAVPRDEVATVSRLVETLPEGSARLWPSQRPAGVSRLTVVVGGRTRQESVALAVAACDVEAGDLILVHDAARPAVEPQDVEAVIQAAMRDGVAGAVLGRAMTDTVKKLEGETLGETLDRERLFRIETPQVFRAEALLAALEHAAAEGASATDESTLVERSGGRVIAVEATAENPKLTVAKDLDRLRFLLT
jgi:2-C-methyl-D-erythritol 4-phosphate cytidylyltransferase